MSVGFPVAWIRQSGVAAASARMQERHGLRSRAADACCSSLASRERRRRGPHPGESDSADGAVLDGALRRGADDGDVVERAKSLPEATAPKPIRTREIERDQEP